MKTYGKQRLFEVMGRLDGTFKPRLYEGNDAEDPNQYANPDAGKEYPNPSQKDNKEDNQVREFLAQQLNILDWDSAEGQQKRKQVADAAMNAATQIENVVKSSVSGPEKAAKVQTLLTGTGIFSTLLGLWGLLSNTHRVTYSLLDKAKNWLHGGEPLTNHIEWGGTFFLKVAFLLLILKIIHKLLYKGTVLQNDVNSIWNYIRGIIGAITGKGNVQESLVSLGDQKMLKEMLEYDPSLNEDENEFLPISAPEGSPDDKLFMDIVNQGIDSSLEGFTKSKFEIKNGSLGNRRIFNFHKSELPIVLRRLEDMGTPEAQQWKQDIEDYEKNVGEISEEITTGKGNSAEGLIFDFPGHARQSNPVDSPQYQWYVKVLNFVNGNNNVYEKAELIEFFQNNFIGMDYDVLQTPAEAVSWWLSPEHQEFIKDELNS